MPSDCDLRLIDRLHGGFPLCDRPFAAVAQQLGCSEDTLIDRLQGLLAHGDLTRFGPLFQIERAGGRFVLAAMAVNLAWLVIFVVYRAYANATRNTLRMRLTLEEAEATRAMREGPP